MSDPYVQSRLHIVEMLEQLLASGKCIMLIRSDAHNDAGKGYPYYEGNAGRKHVVSEDLEGCIEEMTDNPRRRVCSREGCPSKGRPLPLSRMAKDNDSHDGRASVCKDCESKRQKAIHQKKKSKE